MIAGIFHVTFVGLIMRLSNLQLLLSWFMHHPEERAEFVLIWLLISE